MLDLEGITMKGKIHDSFFAKKSYYSSIEGAVKFGKQTNMFLADTFNFNGQVKLKDLKKMILANPFSYHLLYSVKNIRHSLSDRQILSLLECFDDDVQASNTASEMKSYIASRGKIKLSNTTLTDSAGKQHLILDQKAKLNMVILWASWCGPCRAEIPQLKKVYKKFRSNENFKMVSVSVDSENLKWKKALKEEKMPWKQLLTEREIADYYKELFDVNNSIPTTLFYDSNGKLIKKYIGYDAANEVEVMDLIIANLK
ncbi:TlpA disulfide reductase family protein [Dyadobacter sp. CY312]|uniref:TlpA family protein disulfide reductase n=1 Tax=Dyadobacter sp. CY312 TaxID=2907303 RepID=UPI001F321592|nr:TlpA disulfide reductase family protein [Dyadobacter sp. CY312]MCE7041972.1 TlpA family protein disulfide reductase [Dyadobacter sp. CY312]